MDLFNQFRQQVRNYLLATLIGSNLILIAIFWALSRYTSWPPLVAGTVALALGAAGAVAIARILTRVVVSPLQLLRQTILQFAAPTEYVQTLKADDLSLGRELIVNLAAQVGQLANVAQQVALTTEQQIKDLSQNFIAQNLPLPLLVLDPAESIVFANKAAAEYIGIEAADMTGKNIYMVLDMSFPSEATFDNWLKEVKNKTATASSSWERVKLNVRDGHPERLFDLAAYYNRDNPENHETILTLFDHTKMYSQDDQAVSFLALSVHELRTPLTLLRGYIEVFEEELANHPDPELHSFMQKMRSQFDQLMAYVNNILNVARVDADQLELRLESADWPALLKDTIESLALRAKVRNISLQCRIQTNLPAAGVDKLSIREVINNLIDNAIKYSGQSKVIKIETRLNQEGMIETTVQDFGVGIPASVIPNLFTKFYRDHRNRAQIGGTGLGLYLSKAIIGAHGGSLWVRSQEGQGSTFGFTIQPYDRLSDEKKQGDEGLVRSAHGWIKNHSLYRR